MPSIYELKPKFQNLLRPLCKKLAVLGVTANQITLCACFVSLIVGGILFIDGAHRAEIWWLLPIWFFIRMALNAIDGMLAREFHMKSALGALLNEMTDVISDSALYLPFAFLPGVRAEWIVSIVLISILTEMLGVVAVQIGASRRYDGPMGKSDRALFFGILSIFIALRIPLQPWIPFAFLMVLILLLKTIWNRGNNALKEIKS